MPRRGRRPGRRWLAAYGLMHGRPPFGVAILRSRSRQGAGRRERALVCKLKNGLESLELGAGRRSGDTDEDTAVTGVRARGGPADGNRDAGDCVREHDVDLVGERGGIEAADQEPDRLAPERRAVDPEATNGRVRGSGGKLDRP